jgi:hypothetical protein
VLRVLQVTGILALGFVIVESNLLYWRGLRQLRATHVNVWERLGKPSFPFISITSQFRVLWFLLAGEYRQLGDPVLTRIFNFQLTLLLLLLPVMAWVGFAVAPSLAK